MKEHTYTLIVTDAATKDSRDEYRFDQDKVLIGRSRSNDLTLLNEQRAVSRQHAEIHREPGHFKLVDLGSKNTTRLNGQPLIPGQSAPLRHGDRIRIGTFEIEVQLPMREDTAYALDLFHESANALLTRMYGVPTTEEKEPSGPIEVEPERAVEELVVLSELAFDLGASFDLQETIDKILRRTIDAVGAEQGVVTLVKPDDAVEADTLIRIRLDDLLPDYSLGEHLLEWMQTYKQPLRLNQREVADSTLGVTLDESIRSILCMPLVVRTKLIGILTIYNKQDASQFTESDERLVAIIAAQSAQIIENTRFHERARALEEAEKLKVAYDALEEAHQNLKATQAQLIQAEKLASLGQLTAGIAHEIKNPLNFILNFASLSAELVDELAEELQASKQALKADTYELVEEILSDLKSNAEKIQKHGHRADDIVISMLDHSQNAAGERRPVVFNRFVEEHVQRAFDSVRANAPDFSCTVDYDLGDDTGALDVVPQDLGRALVNVVDNAFYAVHEKAQTTTEAYEPTVSISTRREEGNMLVRVQDNGAGIAESMLDKVFEPFFTTKPPGSGTGLGLSLAYDIIVHGHGGTLIVERAAGEGVVFNISLPLVSNPSLYQRPSAGKNTDPGDTSLPFPASLTSMPFPMRYAS